MANEELYWFIVILAIIVIIVLLFAVMNSAQIIKPWEQGIKIQLGRFRPPLLNPGLNWVVPFITQVIRVDLRTQVFDVPRQEVITKDNSPTNVDAIIYIKIIDPKRAIFEITNYRVATIALAQTTLRSIIGDMELDEILYNRHTINAKLRDILDEETDKWGVKVENVEIREVDPVGPVKAAMEEQTSAERERRAAILRADGTKRAEILKAEGAKRSRILQAEGIKQSMILEAEGSRLAKILEMQGEAQSLRILTLGSALLDEKALTVKSLNTLAAMADGKATKIIFPFEISRLIEGATEYIGAGRNVPKSSSENYDALESRIGKSEDVLGEIPSVTELKKELEELQVDKAVMSQEEIERIAHGGKPSRDWAKTSPSTAPSKNKDGDTDGDTES